MKRKIRISLPILFTTFIPYTIFKDLNTYLESDKSLQNRKKENRPYDLEVLVHVSASGSGKVGHVDLYYKGEIMSYGNYDMKSRFCNEVFGDGVLFTVKSKKDYLQFCQEHSKKILFGFGLSLTENQKRRIDQEIEEMKRDMVEWIPYYRRALESKEVIDENDYQDYASNLYKTTKAKFYKFNKGKFKNFFVLSTNCVQLVDTVLGKTGIDLIKLTGFISPGSYYDYLFREYHKKNSMVVSYNVYGKSLN